MIYLGFLGEVRNVEISKDDKKYLIVRKPASGIPNGFIHLPLLSPSKDLFYNSFRWKKNLYNKDEILELRKLDVFEYDDKTWWNLYKGRFINELKGDLSKKAIDILLKDKKNGIDSWLFCYCKELETCHRILVGKYLKEIGFEVHFREEDTSEDCQLSFLS